MPSPNRQPGPWSEPPPKSRRWPWLVILGVALAGLVVWLLSVFPEAVRDEDDGMALFFRLLLVAGVGTSLLVHHRIRAGRAMKYMAAWVGIALVIFLGYSLRHELSWMGGRMAGELLPHRPEVTADEVVLRARSDGHFALEADVDGVPIRFLVDTGASDVVLSPRDAERLGFETADLSFHQRYNTANGVVHGAPVRLGRVAVGPIALENVRASVNGADMRMSLLGMSFLGRLKGFEVKPGRMIFNR